MVKVARLMLENSLMEVLELLKLALQTDYLHPEEVPCLMQYTAKESDRFTCNGISEEKLLEQ
jgi:hypothetical protein